MAKMTHVLDWRTKEWRLTPEDQAFSDKVGALFAQYGVWQIVYRNGFKAVVAVVAPVAGPAVGVAQAAGWGTMFAQALLIADWLVVGVIMFAGASWMFGNRTKALDLLIGGASGYIVIRKAVLIRDFLRGL